MLHATETHRPRQLLCHSTGCGLATKMTVVCVLTEILPWILSLWWYQDLFIKIKMSWLTWTPLSVSRVMSVGESLLRPALHEQPASPYIFLKSWCSVIKHSPSPQQPASWGYLSKGDQLQPNESLLKLENFPWALLGTQSESLNYSQWWPPHLPLVEPKTQGDILVTIPPSYRELTPKGEARLSCDVV